MRPFIKGESFQNIIKATVPDFVEAEYPLFVSFITAYLNFLEQPRTFVDKTIYPEYGTTPNSIVQATSTLGGPFYEGRKLLEYRDVDSSLDEFKTHFLAMFAKNFPNFTYVPSDLFIRSLKQFYQGKGTVESIEWLFRVLFNEEAEVVFPRNDILRASDGTWTAPLSLKVTAPLFGRPNKDVPTFYVGQRVQTVTGSAQVETVITTVVGQSYSENIVVNELKLKFGSLLGFFLPGQELFNVDSPGEVVTTVILPVIVDVIVNSGGSNYDVGDVVTFSEGPSGGGGFGAFGIVSVVSNTAISAIDVSVGGSGFLVGEPITFVSVSGNGASAVVDEIVFGDFELEDGTGFFLLEDQVAGSNSYMQLEDQNMLLLGLSIDPFVNSTATVLIDDPDYGLSTGVESLLGRVIDDEISYALAALDPKPFMHPWVFTNQAGTTADLANAAVLLNYTSNTFFSNAAVVFSLSSLQDATTNATTSDIEADSLISVVAEGGLTGELFLKNFSTGIGLLVANTVLKQAGNGTSQVGTLDTVNGSANVVGTNTVFTKVCLPNTHLRFNDGTHAVVRQVVNDTFLVTFAVANVTLLANSYSTVPTGTVTEVMEQEQRYYGKIKSVRLLTNGQHYLNPPALFVDSVSARAQELFHLNPDPFPPVDTHSSLNEVVASPLPIDVFEDAVLIPEQSTGQIQKVKILSSGVNYTDANAIVATAIHGFPRTGDNAVFTVVTGALTQAAGRYTTSRGFLSADKFLQDATFYNDYTYVIRVAESFDRYRDILLKLTHPAGFHVLGTVVDVLAASLTVPEAIMVLRERVPLPLTLLISDPGWGNGVFMPRTIGSLEDFYDGDHDI